MPSGAVHAQRSGSSKTGANLRRQDLRRLGGRSQDVAHRGRRHRRRVARPRCPRNEFLCTTKSYGDFELRLKFKLSATTAQRRRPVPHQAHPEPPRGDRLPGRHGPGYWGALYDESRRNKMLQSRPGEDEERRQARRLERVRHPLRGAADPALAQRRPDRGLHRRGPESRHGVIGLQIHGGASEARYKDITLLDLTK